jgi:hypothetical protein
MEPQLIFIFKLAEIGTPQLISSNCSRKLIPAINRIAASQFPLSADWLAAIVYLQREATYFGFTN